MIKNILFGVDGSPGSEVARGAIIITDDHRKLGFHSWHLLPKSAICDPELTLGLPPGPMWKALQSGQDVTWRDTVLRSADWVSHETRRVRAVFGGDNAEPAVLREQAKALLELALSNYER